MKKNNEDINLLYLVKFEWRLRSKTHLIVMLHYDGFGKCVEQCDLDCSNLDPKPSMRSQTKETLQLHLV